MKNVEFLKLIGKRTYREVYKLKWMELLCATKKIEIDYNKSFIKEVSILVSLSHPNLISYYFAIKDITNERSGYCGPKIKKKHVYLGMELVQISLSSMLEKMKKYLTYF